MPRGGPSHTIACTRERKRSASEDEARRTTPEHTLTAALGFGEGRLGEERHRDASWAVGDEWLLTPRLRIDTGVRGEYRRAGDADVHVTSPRVAIVYAIPNELSLLAGFQRLPRLDDGLPGAWRGTPALYHDELTAGGSHMIGDDMLIGVAGRARRTGDATTLGADAWLRVE